jgi:hypothetical protein
MGLIHKGRTIHQYPFIGWVSLNCDYGSDMSTLSMLIDDICSSYSGQIYTSYVYSHDYYEEGIVFSKERVPLEEAQSFYHQQLSLLDWDQEFYPMIHP